jgi:hypothetical protein
MRMCMCITYAYTARLRMRVGACMHAGVCTRTMQSSMHNTVAIAYAHDDVLAPKLSRIAALTLQLRITWVNMRRVLV